MTEYYEKMLKLGLEYQDFVVDKLYEIGIPIISYSSKHYQYTYGENKGGIEIKHDQRLNETGNLFFEIDEKSNAANKQFIKSGIYRDDNTFMYAIGNYSVLYLCMKKSVQRCYEWDLNHDETKRRGKILPSKTNTSHGWVISKDFVEQNIAGKIIRFDEKGRIIPAIGVNTRSTPS
jgi:hypothetical protein